MKRKGIGPNFSDELRAVNVPLDGFAWGDDGVIQFSESVSPAIRDMVANVYRDHDPARPAPITVQIDPAAASRMLAAFVAQKFPDCPDAIKALANGGVQSAPR